VINLQHFHTKYAQEESPQVVKLCRLGNVEAILHAIGQTIALLGPNHHDTYLQPNGKLIFALKRQFQLYKKEDPLPTHEVPLPVKHIELAVQACYASNMEKIYA
jgi:hypothetical protein